MAKVLVIDDSNTVLKSMKLNLECYGHQIETVQRYSELIIKLMSFTPDIIFLDLDMPGFDGFQTNNFLKKYYGDILPKVIIYTSNKEQTVLNSIRDKINPNLICQKTSDYKKINDLIMQLLQ